MVIVLPHLVRQGLYNIFSVKLSQILSKSLHTKGDRIEISMLRSQMALYSAHTEIFEHSKNRIKELWQ